MDSRIKKVCICHSVLSGGGVEKFIQQIVNGISDVRFYFLYTGSEPYSGQFIENKNVMVYNNPSTKLLTLKGIKYLVKIMRYFMIRDYYSILTTSYVIALCAILAGRKNIIVTQRNLWSLQSKKNLLLVRLLGLSKEIIFLCNNQVACNKLQNAGIHQKKTIYIPNGIEVKQFSRDFNKDKSEIKLVMLSRFVGTKRFDFVVDSIKCLIEKGFHNTIDFLGEGPLENYLKDYIDTLSLEDYIKIKSFHNINNLDSYDIGVLITDTEGFPNVILEYAVKHLPVIISDYNGIDLILEHEKTALITSQDPEEIAYNMMRLIQSNKLRKNLSDNLLLQVENKFSLDKMTNRVEQLLTK